MRCETLVPQARAIYAHTERDACRDTPDTQVTSTLVHQKRVQTHIWNFPPSSKSYIVAVEQMAVSPIRWWSRYFRNTSLVWGNQISIRVFTNWRFLWNNIVSSNQFCSKKIFVWLQAIKWWKMNAVITSLNWMETWNISDENNYYSVLGILSTFIST